MKFNIALIPGDGIGPEVVRAACAVLDKTAEKFGHIFNYTEVDAGGISIDKYGVPLTEKAAAECMAADSVLLGAVGGPKWENIPGVRPEQALLGLRSKLELYTNLRPVKLFSVLAQASPLKSEIIKNGIDILIVRELTGGIYFGKSGTQGESAFDTEEYSKSEIKRVMENAVAAAEKRRKKITVVDKANVLETSRLWRKTAIELVNCRDDIKLEFMYVDNASMQLIRNPNQFDVIVTTNMFGDILSDEASMLTGSIGMLPSASIGKSNLGMYEPIHGSAPDIAGQNKANPLAAILSAAMMLEYSFNMPEEAAAIEAAVENVLEKGYRTADIMSEEKILCSTEEMTKYVCRELDVVCTR